MKKLFTTILMMGVALVGWASVTKTLSGNVLTINYVSDPSAPNELSSLSLTNDEKVATTLVLTGDWSNKDLVKIGSLVGECTNNVYLDLSACEKFESRISYTGEGDPNWVTNDFEILPNGTSTVTVPVTVTDAFSTVTVIDKPVTVTVEGDELIYTHNQASVKKTTVYNIQNVGDVTDLPEEFMTNPVITKTYSYPGIYGDNNSYLKYDESDGKWYAYAWSSKLLVSKNEKDIYSYEDENGDTQTQDNTNGLTEYSDGWYYDCYTYKDSGQKLNDLNGVIQVGDKWYKATSTTYAFEDENGDPCSQDNPNNPKPLTKNADGTYSYICYVYTDNNGQQQVKYDTNGLTQQADGSWGYPLGKRYSYTYNGVTSAVDGNQCTENADGTYSYTFAPAVFSFAGSYFSNNRDKLSGVSFPNNVNFDAIPEGMFSEAGNLTDVVFGDYIQWIGKKAFNLCPYLNNVTFPETLKVIGIDAFFGCTSFTAVNIDLPNLVRVDAAAFNMGDVDANNLTDITLPTTTNNKLEFFANQVFSSSHVEELDFSKCLLIKHFAYDLEEYFGETVPSEVSNTSRTFTWHVDLKKITLPPNLLHVGDECFFNCTSLQHVIFSGEADYDKDACENGNNKLNNPLTIGEKACYNLGTLTQVDFSNNVTLIKTQAFYKTNLAEVRIPASVEEIQIQAFAENSSLLTVVFEEIDDDCAPCKHANTVVKQKAFENVVNLEDVYVNTVVDITCENEGFSRETTFGQGDASAHRATLHFPEGHEAHYTNLDHYLTNEIAANPGEFQKWLVDHMAAAMQHETGFGWYEFVNTGSKSVDPDNPTPIYDPDPTDPEKLPLILRTFSDPNYARIVPDGMRAYVVNSVEEVDGNYQLTLYRLSVIPAQTGVILFGQPNSKDENGNYMLTMSAVAFAPGHGQPLRRDYWDMLSTADQKFKNYLYPIIDNATIRSVADDGTQSFEEGVNLLTVNPYEPYKVKGATIEWRNFGLNRMDQTTNLYKKFDFTASVDNYAGFFRMLPGTYKSGYAYLKLAAVAKKEGKITWPVEYASATGAECVVVEDEGYTTEYLPTGASYNADDKDECPFWKGQNRWENRTKGWGTRAEKFNTPGAVSFLGELDDTDGFVKLVVPANKMGEVFSISGMKVSNPSKGIYIQNGKKIIIK